MHFDTVGFVMSPSRYRVWLLCMRFVCVGGLGKKAFSRLFALFIIALLMPCLDMCGYPFYSGQKKSIYQVQNGR